MKQKHLLIMILVYLLQAVGWTEQATSRQHAFKNYDIISERNVFSKHRTPITGGPKTTTKEEVMALYVLKGIAKNGPQRMAFIENTISGVSMQAVIGTSFPEGIINDILVDHLLYEENGTSQQVSIGDVISKTVKLTEVLSDSGNSAVLKEMQERSID